MSPISNNRFLLCICSAEKKFKQWFILWQKDNILLKHPTTLLFGKAESLQSKTCNAKHLFTENSTPQCAKCSGLDPAKHQSPWFSLSSWIPISIESTVLLTYLPDFLEDVGRIPLHRAGLGPNLKNMLSSLMLLLFFWRKCFNVAIKVVSDTLFVLKSLLTTKGILLWTYNSLMIRALSWRGKDVVSNPWSKPDRAGNWTWLSSVRD